MSFQDDEPVAVRTERRFKKPIICFGAVILAVILITATTVPATSA
jgi:hypothetical protein